MDDPSAAARSRSFPRTPGCLPEIFEFLDDFFASEGIRETHRLPMHFVVEEWFTNMVKYSRGGSADITLELRRRGDRLFLGLSETGVAPFDIRTIPDVDVSKDIRERNPGGLGIHLLKRMVDDIRYEYADGRSTTTFVKTLEA